MAKKTKSFDLISMQREKLRLMKECADYEKKLLGHLDTLREHPVQMAISSVLPFSGIAKNGVMQGLELINDTILPVVLGATFKKGRDSWTKNIFQVSQALLISVAFRFFKKMMNKRKEAKAKAAEEESINAEA